MIRDPGFHSRHHPERAVNAAAYHAKCAIEVLHSAFFPGGSVRGYAENWPNETTFGLGGSADTPVNSKNVTGIRCNAWHTEATVIPSP